MLKVIPIEDSPTWEPNAPQSVLWTDDNGRVVLAMNAHEADPDQSAMVVVWRAAHTASMGDPNDEGRHTHPLYGAGLSTLQWMGEVAGAAPRRFIIPMKEGVAEVVADQYAVVRIPGSSTAAANAALDLDWETLSWVDGPDSQKGQ